MSLMFIRIISTYLFFLLFSLTVVFSADEKNVINTIFKIKTYERNSIDGNYTLINSGSAILIDGNKIITNAHLILDSDKKSPTGYYEICYSVSNKKQLYCYTTAKLISLDTSIDLAILEPYIAPTTSGGVLISDMKKFNTNNSVVVYGYQSAQDNFISRTEGEIYGNFIFYKFDGTLYGTSSGGGVFGLDGRFLGITYPLESTNTNKIGYFIPSSLIQEFVSNKASIVQKGTKKIYSTFNEFIKNSQLQTNYDNSIINRLARLEKNPNNLRSRIDLQNYLQSMVLIQGRQVPMNTKNINMVCMGDSNTYGVNLPTDKRYSNIIGRLNSNGFTISNIGGNGYKVTDLLKIMPTLLFPKKDPLKRNIVTILIGTNDFGSKKSVITVWSQLQILIADIKKQGWEVWIMTYPPKSGDNLRNTKIVEFNTLIKSNFKRLGYSIIDIYAEFINPIDINYMKNGLSQDDNLHFSNLGHNIISKKLEVFFYIKPSL